MRPIKLTVPTALFAMMALVAPRADAQNGLGARFDERAMAASSSRGGDFEPRTGSLSGDSTSDSRWPASQLGSSSGGLGGDSSSRFGESSTRFPEQDRLAQNSKLSSSGDLFPGSSLDKNQWPLDKHYDKPELDKHYDKSGLNKHYDKSGLDKHYDKSGLDEDYDKSGLDKDYDNW